MKGRLFSVAIISCMALFLFMAGTSWGADESPPVCLKDKADIVNADDPTNVLTGNWSVFITDKDEGILQAVMRLEYNDGIGFFRHHFELGEPISQPTLNFLENRFCDMVTASSAEIAQAFGFPAGTPFVFTKVGVAKGEVVPDEQGDVGSNYTIGDIEDLLIPGSIFPWHYAALYKAEIFKQPVPAGGGEIPGGGGGTGEVILIQAEDYNTGGEGIGYHDLSAGNQCGDYRQDDVDIKLGRDGVIYICRPRDGEWLAYDVFVQGGLYNLTLRVANKDMASNAVHVEIDGVDVTGSLSLPVTGDFQNWTTITTSLNLTSGSHLLTIYMEGVDFSLDWWQLESSP